MLRREELRESHIELDSPEVWLLRVYLFLAIGSVTSFRRPAELVGSCPTIPLAVFTKSEMAVIVSFVFPSSPIRCSGGVIFFGAASSHACWRLAPASLSKKFML